MLVQELSTPPSRAPAKEKQASSGLLVSHALVAFAYRCLAQNAFRTIALNHSLQRWMGAQRSAVHIRGEGVHPRTRGEGSFQEAKRG